MKPEFSFVVPLYQTGQGLNELIRQFRELWISESWELVLVDDGSSDHTFELAQQLTQNFPATVKLVEHARNYGEHAAVLEGYRHAEGRYIVNLDDDLQNPLSEAVRLVRYLRDEDHEVVYSYYECKKHHLIRNVGSFFTNAAAYLLIGKPQSLYLSSFRAITHSLKERLLKSKSPYPHIDGLILGSTQRIGRLLVRHDERFHGHSTYTLGSLCRVAINLIFDYSILPLRISTVLGGALCGFGFVFLILVFIEKLREGREPAGWASVMGAVSLFSGAQLFMLGVMGEYLGRAYLALTGRSASCIRQAVTKFPEELSPLHLNAYSPSKKSYRLEPLAKAS